MSEIQSVNVFSVDEERLKYRVMIGINADQAGIHRFSQGKYMVQIPVPTSFANNRMYNQCLIKCDSFTATTPPAVVDPSWEGDRANALLKMAAVEVRLDVPSSQTSVITVNSPQTQDNGGSIRIGGFRQLLPLQVVNVGDTAGATAAAGGFAWTAIGSGVSSTDPLIAANPFGSRVVISLRNITDQQNCWLGSVAQHAAANYLDRGSYTFQFTITMIPNDRSEGTD